MAMLMLGRHKTLLFCIPISGSSFFTFVNTTRGQRGQSLARVVVLVRYFKIVLKEANPQQIIEAILWLIGMS